VNIEDSVEGCLRVINAAPPEKHTDESRIFGKDKLSDGMLLSMIVVLSNVAGLPER
jgi:hypothetical protein